MKNMFLIVSLAFFISGCFSSNTPTKLHNNTVYEKNDKYYNASSNENIFVKEYKYRK